MRCECQSRSVHACKRSFCSMSCQSRFCCTPVCSLESLPVTRNCGFLRCLDSLQVFRIGSVVHSWTSSMDKGNVSHAELLTRFQTSSMVLAWAACSFTTEEACRSANQRSAICSNRISSCFELRFCDGGLWRRTEVFHGLSLERF